VIEGLKVSILTSGKNGKRITNSISKIKKIIAIRKNWLENLDRLFSRGVNPHSNGLIFSFSDWDFFVNTIVKNVIIALRITEIKITLENIIILRGF
jgi:hypothetical protein